MPDFFYLFLSFTKLVTVPTSNQTERFASYLRLSFEDRTSGTGTWRKTRHYWEARPSLSPLITFPALQIPLKMRYSARVLSFVLVRRIYSMLKEDRLHVSYTGSCEPHSPYFYCFFFLEFFGSLVDCAMNNFFGWITDVGDMTGWSPDDRWWLSAASGCGHWCSSFSPDAPGRWVRDYINLPIWIPLPRWVYVWVLSLRS